MRKYKVALVVGRFQPVHIGHQTLFKKALELADHVLIGIGSANVARCMANPYTALDRENMLRSLAILGERENEEPRVSYAHLNDFPASNHRWTSNTLEKIFHKIEHLDPNKVVVVTHTKPGEPDIAKFFPEFHSIQVDEKHDVCATEIRAQLFETSYGIDNLVGKPLYNYLDLSTQWWMMKDRDRRPEFYKEMWRDHVAIQQYKKDVHQFPRIEQTADAVVVQNGHVLLIQRGTHPSKGQWALPGGFVDQNETVLDACIRELREETGLKVPERALLAKVADPNGVRFDHPRRSQRGRIVTTAFLFLLSSDEKLPKVKGLDDAIDAKWVPLFKIPHMSLYSDHGLIIETLTRHI